MAAQAVIVGATGLVGSACLPMLLERYESVTAFVRKTTGLKSSRLIERVIDFGRLGTVEIPFGAHVYCALGTTIKDAGSQEAFRRVDQDYPRMLAERASGAGGARFVLVSSVGADARSSQFYLRVKGELEDQIRGMAFQAVHIFRPSLILGERAERRVGEKIGVPLARVVGPLLMGSFRKYRAIPAVDVARAMVAAGNKEVAGCFIYHFDEIKWLAAV
jgi:uncharacterized protein YbjT (DUF2867 family)